MIPGPGAVLRQIAKTAALAGGFGLLLYLGLTWLAEIEGAPWIIGLVLAVPMAGFVGWIVWDALHSGIFPMRFSSPTRQGEPLAYWGSVLWFAACGAMLAALAGWCAMRLLAG